MTRQEHPAQKSVQRFGYIHPFLRDGLHNKSLARALFAPALATIVDDEPMNANSSIFLCGMPGLPRRARGIHAFFCLKKAPGRVIMAGGSSRCFAGLVGCRFPIIKTPSLLPGRNWLRAGLRRGGGSLPPRENAAPVSPTPKKARYPLSARHSKSRSNRNRNSRSYTRKVVRTRLSAFFLQ